MATKFGFQVTVQDRMIWIFPEDVDAAALAAKAEAEMTKYLLGKLKEETPDALKKILESLPSELPAGSPESANTEYKNQLVTLKEKAGDQENTEAIAQFLVDNASIQKIKGGLEKVTGAAKNEVDNQLNALKAKANAGITYSWTRGPGEDPIQLGTLADLVNFMQVSIIESLPAIVRPNFNVRDQFNALVGGFPDPINTYVDAFATQAVFELDGIRLKIPGKGSEEYTKDSEGREIVKKPKTQFEVAMLINLLSLELKLGPFQVNRLYAKLGNFEPPQAETAP